jgi:hypothetical protein
VGAGRTIWSAKAGCSDCHGWSGNGFSSAFHAEGRAPSLRETQLTRDQIRETIQCGRPGTPMPHFDRFAYTDKRCYDMTAEELGDRKPNRAPTTLQSYEIDALADYVAPRSRAWARCPRRNASTTLAAGEPAATTTPIPRPGLHAEGRE